MKLSDEQRRLIISRIEALFEGTKARLLGRMFKGPKMYFEVIRNSDPFHTIEGIYTYTLNMLYGSGIRPEEKTIENLNEITGNYIDSQHLKVKNHILADVAHAKTPIEAIKAIKTHFDKAGKYVDMLMANETRIAQAYASREGISRVASDIGVADPTVVFLGVCDHKICKYCKAMYHDSANLKIPKPYKLSQVREGYFKPKEWDGKTPYHAPNHPRCRHSMSFIPPGFGYTDSGQIEFKAFGYDYHKEYWGLKKSEEIPNLTPQEPRFFNYDEYLEMNIEHEKEHVCGENCSHDIP